MKNDLHILVCDSGKPKIQGGGCCNDKSSRLIIDAFHDELTQRGLELKIKVLPAACMRNCLSGISVKILPDNTLYGSVKVADVPEIIDDHLIKGQPIKRLLADPPSTLLGI